jgi:hypothetical protein
MVSIAEAERIRRERIRESRTRASETRKKGSEASAQRLRPALSRVAAQRDEVLVMISYLISCVISYHMYI